MFDKEAYWKNRNEGKRGQNELITRKFHPKGVILKYTTSDGEEAEYANSIGTNGLNRKQRRA